MSISRDIPFAALSALAAVAKHASLTVAAKQLGITASAVSQALVSLEKRIGAPVVVRGRRGVRLTETGELLVARCEPALRQVVDGFEEAVAVQGQLAGKLRLNVPRISIPSVISPVLPELRLRYPKLDVEITVDDAFVDIVAGRFDAGVRLSESIEGDMVAVRLTPEFRFVIVGSPEFLARYGTPKRPRDLEDVPCVVFRGAATGATYRWELSSGKREHIIAVSGPLVTNDHELMVNAALSGIGLAYVSEPLVRHHLVSGALVSVLSSYRTEVPGHFAYFPRSNAKLPRLRAFLDTARSVLLRSAPIV
ncbi:MAG: LysR family transcriptional regulator [Polyangiaceae bacterium]